jgi:biopolymer transport protein ExbB
MTDFSTAATFFKQGGVFMYFMLGVAVVVISIATERFIVIARASSLNGRKLMDDLVRAVKRGDMVTARNITRMSGAPAAQVAETMLQFADADPVRLQAASEDAATLALAPLSRRLPHLNVLANVATLLGLLGTISGLITAFSAVGAADPAQRSAFMAAGISTALNATAFGLIIAIPTLLLQGFLVGMVDGVAEQVDEMSIRLNQALGTRAANLGASNVVAIQGQKAAGAVSVKPGLARGGAQ